jgi:Tfp pilus assembly protein PilF
MDSSFNRYNVFTNGGFGVTLINIVMETMALERFVQSAENAFEQSDYLEGMRILEQALIIEPCYGKAHNYMGWLYLYQINDWDKAEIHLKLALKYAPTFSEPYINMSYLLFEKGKFDELTELLTNAIAVGGVQKSFIYNEYGKMFEANGKLRKAVNFYKAAVRWAFNEQDLNNYKDNIRRCRDKRWIMLF